MIDLLESEEQSQIVESLRRFLAEHMPVSRLRSAASGTDHAAWNDLAGMGAIGIGAPEAVGGVDRGLPDEALVFRELGRVAATPSFLATWLALRLALDAGEIDRATRLVAGEERACFALPAQGEGCLLIDAPGAAAAVTVVGDTVQVMDIVAGETELMAALNWTIPVARTNANSLALRGETSDAGLVTRFDIVAAAMLAGLAEAARDLAVAYACTREQFGQPIGGFQAIKHKCADMEVRCTAAWSQVLFAALSVDASDPSGSYSRHAARMQATDAAIENAEAGIQIHGGMGFTAECDAHIFLKRARALARLGASAAERSERLLELDAPGPERQTAEAE